MPEEKLLEFFYWNGMTVTVYGSTAPPRLKDEQSKIENDKTKYLTSDWTALWLNQI